MTASNERGRTGMWGRMSGRGQTATQIRTRERGRTQLTLRPYDGRPDVSRRGGASTLTEAG